MDSAPQDVMGITLLRFTLPCRRDAQTVSFAQTAVFVMAITALSEGKIESSRPGGLGNETNRMLCHCARHDRRNWNSAEPDGKT